jgi:cell division transport system permease protein
MLLSVNILWSLEILTSNAVGSVKQQIDVSFYFSAEAKDKDVGEIVNYVSKFPEVVTTSLISKENVLKAFTERHKNQTETLAALKELGANPFGPTLVVNTKEPKDYAKVISALDVPEYKSLIESRSFDSHDDAIDRLQKITNRIETVGLGLTIMFAIISFLIIFNTIRVAIAGQRAEIGIKRLVGASNWFIRGPYIVESLLFTIISIFATVVVIWLALRWAEPYLSVVFPKGFSLTNYYKSNIFFLLGIQTVVVLFLTIFSSGLAMRRQLKV